MDFAAQVKSSVDIARVIGEYLRLKKAGAGSARYVGLCPFHIEKTPSFSVNTNFQIFNCFGCGEKGDVFTFVMKMDGLTFPEAVRALAERNGIPMPVRREANDPQSQLRDAILAMHEEAAKVFEANLRGPNAADARAYVAKRGLSEKMTGVFGLGYAERAGQDLVRRLQKQYSPEQMEASGLVGRRAEGSGYYDRFRGRLMFPIHNESGKVIAFGGRALFEEDEAKYLNSPETPIYHKSSVLYNLHRAKAAVRKNDSTVLVEGYMDVIGVYSAGVENVMASCGTALTPLQVRAARRHSENIVVNFDPDNAGANATEKSLQILLDESMNVKVLALEGGLDPDEYIKTHGPEVYREKLGAAPGYFLWLADRVRKKHNMRTAEGRMAGLEFLLPAIKRISDKLERAAVADEVAAYLGIDRGLVLDEFRKSAVQRQARPTQAAHAGIPKAERVLLRSLLVSREVRDVLVPQLSSPRALQNFSIQPILYTVCTLHESQPEFAFGDLEGRLSDKDKALLATVIFEDHADETLSAEQAVTYLRVLEADQRQTHAAEIRRRIAEAEGAGDLNLAFQLMSELNVLQRG
jgi:DNA primase